MKKILKKLNVFEKILLLLSLFVLVSLFVYTFTGSNLYFNSDTATANLLAEEIVRTHQYFPENWYWGPDIWVFFLHTFIAVFTLFSDDYLLMRSLAASLFIIMAVLSCFYCSKKVTKNNFWLIAIPLLFCGISWEYSVVVFGQCAYILSLTYCVFFPALFCDSVDLDTFKVKSKPKFILLLFLIFFINIAGVRSLQIVSLPLLCAIVLMYIYEHHKDTIKDFIESSLMARIITGLVAAAVIAGFICFKIMSTSMHINENLPSAADIHYSDMDVFQNLKIFFNDFINLFGIEYSASLFSFSGIINVIKAVMGILLLVVFPVLQLLKFNKEERSLQFFMLFSAVHIFEIYFLSFFCLVLPADSSRYLFSCMILQLILSAHYIYKYLITENFDIIKSLSLVALLVYVIPISLPKFTSFVGYDEAMAEKREITDYLKSKGLTYGYASYWNAGVNTALSNGEVEINHINVFDRVYRFYWLNSSDRYEAHQGTSFLLLTDAENEIFVNTPTITTLGDPLYVDQHNGYWIYVYKYNIALNEFMGYDPVSIAGEIAEQYSVEDVFYFNTEENFVQEEISPENAEGKQLSGEMILVDEDHESSYTLDWITDNYELMGSYDGLLLYYSEEKLVDTVNGLPVGDETVNIDHPYTAGIINNCDYSDGKWVTSGDFGFAFYGPYAPIENGKYKISLYYDYINTPAPIGEDNKDVFDILVNGDSVLASAALDPDQDRAELTVDFTGEGVFEYRLFVASLSKIEIKYIELEKAA